MSYTPLSMVDLVAEIEPSPSSWKSEVLPLIYTRATTRLSTAKLRSCFFYKMVQGGGFEPPKLARQIYSLIPLATREPLRKQPALSGSHPRLSTGNSVNSLSYG